MRVGKGGNRQRLLDDPALMVKRARLWWPEDIRRSRWFTRVGVTFLHVCNLLLWGGICVQMLRDLSGIPLLAIILPAAVFVGNVALAVEEEIRQWRATR